MKMTQREFLQARDGYGCFYCSATGPARREMIVGSDADGHPIYQTIVFFNFDHVLPRAQGGCNHADNKVWSCVFCNSEKSDEIPTVHRWKPRTEAMRHIHQCHVVAERRARMGLSPDIPFPTPQE